MRKLIAIYIFFISAGLFAYNPSSELAELHTENILLNNSSTELSVNSTYKEFERAAKKNGISHRKINTLKSVKNGYYIVAGVFGSELNAKKLVKTFQKKGFNANYIKNTAKGLNYVYLDYHENGENAIAACSSEFEGRYTKEIWVLVANNPKSTIPKIDKKKSAIVSNKKIEKSTSNTNFDALAKASKISTRTFNHLKGVKNGFYLVAGVYSNETSAKKLVKKYTNKGFESGYIKVSETGLNYMYLKHHTDGQNAIDECLSKLDGRYTEKVWVMRVEKSSTITENENLKVDKTQNESILNHETIASDNTDKVSDNDILNTFTFKGVPLSKAKKGPNKSKLIQKADSYFNKLWYAEAAILYEEAIEKDKKNFTFEIIQRTADSHYFNTDMEKANKWYTILYEQFTEEMSADNIFKYAHSLKGTGKYARSKRLMRIYNKKIENDNSTEKINRNEQILDSLLELEQEYELKNLLVNTKYSDFSPMFLDSNKIVFASAKDTSVFNTRRYKWTNQPYLDLYVAKINEESQELKDDIKFSKKINTKYHEASVTFSPDNNTMYFTRNNYGKKLRRAKNGINHLKIYVSKKVNDKWSEAVEVTFNNDEYSTGHPALSPDGKKLYFVSDMPGTIGETDIFVVDVLENNTYSEPRNLGPEVNTEKKEMFPFINDSKLYFSSDGHTGLGGLDVFESKYTEEDGFQTATNLGKPVNSKKDDFSYIINEESQKGYFASNRLEGKGDDDIYAFKRLIVEEVPENKNAIAGVVADIITGDVMPESLVELLDENGIKLKEMVTGDDGSFIFEDLDGDTKYTIRTTKGEFFDEEFETATKDNELVNVDVSLRKLKEMIVIEDDIRKLKTETIFFNFDKHYIRQDASEELDKLVEVMTEYSSMVIKIESHTDSRGPRAYNKYLSDKRAKSTRDYIISRGIDPKRIQSAKGYGEEQLINECDGSVRCSEKQHLLNRRSEFIIVNM